MTLLLKSLLGIGLVGGAGLSLGGYYLFKEWEPKTLEEKFTRECIKILDLSSSDGSSGDLWDKKLEQYNSSEQTQSRFPDLPSSADGTKPDKQKLIEKCKENLTKSYKEISQSQGLEYIVKFWCTSES